MWTPRTLDHVRLWLQYSNNASLDLIPTPTESGNLKSLTATTEWTVSQMTSSVPASASLSSWITSSAVSGVIYSIAMLALRW